MLKIMFGFRVALFFYCLVMLFSGGQPGMFFSLYVSVGKCAAQ